MEKKFLLMKMAMCVGEMCLHGPTVNAFCFRPTVENRRAGSIPLNPWLFRGLISGAQIRLYVQYTQISLSALLIFFEVWIYLNKSSWSNFFFMFSREKSIKNEKVYFIKRGFSLRLRYFHFLFFRVYSLL